MSIIATYFVPHPPITISEIGKGRESDVNKTVKSYHDLAMDIAVLKPETIVIITPHSTVYADYFHISPGDDAEGSFTQFGAPNVNFHVKYNKELAEMISSISLTNNIQAGCLGNAVAELDHGTMVPMYFINKYYSDYNIVRISISDYSTFTHYEFGRCINEACKAINTKVAVIASGDLSHYLTPEGPYGYKSEGPIFDSMICDTLRNASFMDLLKFNSDFITKSGTCAHKPLTVLAGVLDGSDVITNFYSYEGKLGVGYALTSFIPIPSKYPNKNRQFDVLLKDEINTQLKKRSLNENAYVRLARYTVEQLILNNKFLTMNDILHFITEDMLTRASGTFVSIKKNGENRGCVGTSIATTSCIAHEIVNNAINASYNDPRFLPVSVDELPFLTYSVDILYESEHVDSIDDLDVNKYGILVTSKNKRGLLLPNLSSVKTPKQQLEIALKKAGISDNEDYNIERFEVIRYA